MLEQLKLDTEMTPVDLSGQVDKDDDIYNLFYTYKDILIL
jgi:hypothetical protein